jgi:hypothetical protein
MGTKSLTVCGALVFGLWLVLSVWTFTGLATMRIPTGPSAATAPVEQTTEPREEQDAAVAGPVAVVGSPRPASEQAARR